MEEQPVLPLPPVRCLTKEQAAEYLGIGVTLLSELGIPAIKFGRRCVYDKVDLTTGWKNISVEGGPERSLYGP
ncbi:MAG: helix-turn-helix domain-containing protein [Gammaproteobacteria bacterium]|nr:helix-turn-helix domain-containing protein [Gammaproteobacteria bacterium]